MEPASTSDHVVAGTAQNQEGEQSSQIVPLPSAMPNSTARAAQDDKGASAVQHETQSSSLLTTDQAQASSTTVVQSTPPRPPAKDEGGPSTVGPPPAPPSIHKRPMQQPPKGILKPAPPPAKAFSFRRDVLQQLNSRLAQQGVNVQVPISSGGFANTAQGTAQAASNLLGGMFKRVSGLASTSLLGDESGSTTSAGQQAQRADGLGTERDSVRSGSSISLASDSTLTAGQGSSNQPTSTLPTNNLPQPSASARPLRRVRFTVSSMSVVYPISGAITPGEEDATRRRIEQEHRQKLRARRERDWTVTELEQLYRECCRTREEHPLKKMRSVFQEATHNVPPALKTIDLSFVPLDRQAIEPVADILSVDFGLQKLVLENCGLTDDGLKSILHALLVSGSLPSLSLASNKRIKYHGWRYVGIFMRRAKALRYLDLSENSINKASLEHITDALKTTDVAKSASKTGKTHDSIGQPDTLIDDEEAPLTIKADLLNEHVEGSANLNSLRLENCGLKAASLELLSQSVRHSNLSHLSLRRNRINPAGAAALAIMLKDYPDQLMATAEEATAYDGPSVTNGANGAPSQSMNASPHLPDVPVIVSSPGGGVLRRTLPPSAIAALQEASSQDILTGQDAPIDSTDTAEMERALRERQERRRSEEAAIALHHAQRAKRILSAMPRMGNLLTLDLKGNDLRGGVTFLGHALKKNRTLRVLNLSDNAIEVAGLVAIADALKYNSTLETLDMSHNPCSGPALDGITTLRNAFTLNSHLKRLFLSDTDLSSEGAIALAEFLPEAKSLIHLDLTENVEIDIAGVMAMAVSVKLNKSLRCLDLNIPPNAPDFARLSQDILNSCIRNTELAQKRAQQKGVKAPIAAPIYKSSLARAAKEKAESKRLEEANQQLDRQFPHAATDGSEIATGNGQTGATAAAAAWLDVQGASRITEAAQEGIKVLQQLLAREREQEKERVRDREVVRRVDGTIASRPISDMARDLMTQNKRLRKKLQTALGVMQEGEELERALQVNDELEAISNELLNFYEGKDGVAPTTAGVGAEGDGHLTVPASNIDDGLSSPNFSIGSDDEEEEDAVNGVRRGITKAVAGLGIDAFDNASETPLAAREETPVEDKPATMENSRAKGQLSEEGEIFRRARSLSIGRDDEEEEDEEEGEGSATLATKGPTQHPGVESGLISESPLATSKESTVEPSDALNADARSGVTGEELRQELLGAEVPRRSPLLHPTDGLNSTTPVELETQ